MYGVFDIFTIYSVIAATSVPIHAFLEFITSTLHNILSKPLVAFIHTHGQNNGQQQEYNESCQNHNLTHSHTTTPFDAPWK